MAGKLLRTQRWNAAAVRSLGIIVLGLLSLCRPGAAQEPERTFDPPFELPEGVELQESIPYDTTPEGTLHLDLFLPTNRPESVPTVLFIPGFGGDRITEQFWRQAAHLAVRGYASAIIEYRRTQQSGWVRYPESLEDARTALSWLGEEAGMWGLDTAEVAVVGASQGGYLAALLALREAPSAPAGRDRLPRLRAVALFNPALDLTDPHMRAGAGSATFPEVTVGAPFTEDPALWRDASPIHHVRSAGPPFLFLHGTDDTSTPYWQSVRMAAALLDEGVRAEIFTAGGAGHGFFNHPPWYQRTLAQLEEYLDRMLSGGGELILRARSYDRVIAPAPSPDGGKVAMVREEEGNADIFLIDLTTGGRVRLTTSPDFDGGPAWSPDGELILFDSLRGGRRNIFVIRPDGRGLRPLLSDAPGDNGGGEFSPDGSMVAFASDRDGNRELYIADRDGGAVRRLTSNDAFDSAPAWSPRDGLIAFVSDRDGSHDIFTIPSAGGTPTNLTAHPAWDSKPAWSPEGRRIAFLSNRGGKVDLYLMDADGTNVERLTDTVGGEGRPAWFADGQHLVFGLDGQIRMLDLSTGRIETLH